MGGEVIVMVPVSTATIGTTAGSMSHSTVTLPVESH
jgi:hypothetical protein